MKRDYLLFIEDILDSIEKIEQFVGDMDLDEFLEDEKTSTAVIKKLEIIGEASKNIPDEPLSLARQARPAAPPGPRVSP